MINITQFTSTKCRSIVLVIGLYCGLLLCVTLPTTCNDSLNELIDIVGDIFMMKRYGQN